MGIITARENIVPLGKKSGRLEAERIASGLGKRLPSNVLHEDYILGGEALKEAKTIFPAWVREVLVYPEAYRRFNLGKDMVDSETGWTVLWSDLMKLIPPSGLSGKNKGIVIDPMDFLEEEGRVIVFPRSAVILAHFIQRSGPGKVDEATGVPLDIMPEREDKERWLYRTSGAGVRPLIRFLDGYDNYHRLNVGADHKPDSCFGVVIEASEVRAAQKMRTAEAP